MKFQKFIEVLNKNDDTELEFFRKHGQDIFNNQDLLHALIKERWSQKKWYKFINLRWIISTDIRRKHYKEKCYFKHILPLYLYFKDYMNFGCSFFGKMRVPFEEWEDLAKEQVDILKILVERGQLKSWRRTKIRKEFRKKYRKRLQYFIEKGYINEYYLIDPMGL